VKSISEVEKIASEIPGFLLNSEGRFLYDLARRCPEGTVIVEIGSWKGRSTVWLGYGSLAGNRVKVYAIDPHTGSPEHRKIYGKVWTFDKFRRNIRRAGLEDYVVPILKTSAEAAVLFKKKVGLVFVDGDHSYEMVKKDYQLWFPKLIEGGVIVFHDTSLWPGVEKVVKELVFRSSHICNVGFVDSIVYGQKIEQNRVLDRMRNRYLLFLHNIYVLAANLSPPSFLIKVGKKISRILQLQY
jgi:predicted O-methyltransferase YrrM